jgi:hypothetical protein
MDEMSRRITDKNYLLRKFVASNGSKYYKNWRLTSQELTTYLLAAIWKTIQHQDANPEDDLPEYQRFHRFARRELSVVWRELNKAKGRKENLFEIRDSELDMSIISDDSINPRELANCVELLESLPKRQQLILSTLPGAGNRRGAAVGEELGMSMAVVQVQLNAVRTTLQTGEVQVTQGLKTRIIEYLGLEQGTAAKSKAGHVLAKARKELGIVIPKGSRYTHKQCEQVMKWISCD